MLLVMVWLDTHLSASLEIENDKIGMVSEIDAIVFSHVAQDLIQVWEVNKIIAIIIQFS